MLPFTHDQFIGVFGAYNAGIWPAQIVADLLGVAVCVAVVRGTMFAAALAASSLAAMWIWTGVAYHGLFFSKINPAAVAFGVAFALEGLLFVHAALHRRLLFAPHAWRPLRAAAGWALIGYSALVYPVVGWLAGMSYPTVPTFGVTPCPVTLFTFGTLLLATSPPWWLVPIPLAWSLLGGSAAMLLRMPADWVLLASALCALPLLAGRGRASRRSPLA
ncbi:DUF6064 family protein [Ramlibacter sp. MMS24-I3-19]|uniref:DUF6064 family protein n=1 Tax=Ramlibacter sp. MMS24-I3-19 TaxID=3416606 RepID=UPI003D026052